MSASLPFVSEMQDADALSRASASVSLSSCAFIIRRKKSCVNTLRGGVNYAAVMPCTWQAMRGDSHSACSLPAYEKIDFILGKLCIKGP